MEKENNVNLHFYSERGLINRLIEWLNQVNFDSSLKFFQLLNPEINQNSRIDIFNEFSFGDFGSPDLIIKIDNNVYIIEAKITSFIKAATKPEEKYVFKNNASKINIQLLLRKRFIEAIKLSDDEEIVECHQDQDGDIYKNGRALKKAELIDEFVKKCFNNENKFFYVSLTNEKPKPDKDKIFSDYFNKNSFGFQEKEFKMITWQEIDEKIGKDVLCETWTYTDSKYGKD